jgi:hypothetical protein
MTDEERARRMFDWAIDHIRTVAAMIVIQWVVMAVMSFGIITNTRNGSDAARRTSQILEQNAEFSKMIQDYNEKHAKAAGESFAALVQNTVCFTNYFVDFNRAVSTGQPTPDQAILDACFKPAAPQPLPPDDPVKIPRK